MTTVEIPPLFQSLYDEGHALSTDIQKYLDRWPTEDNHMVRGGQLPQHFTAAGKTLCDRTFRWFNRVTQEVLPHTSFHRDYINRLLRRVTAALSACEFREEHHAGGSAFLRRQPSPPRVEHNVEVMTSLDIAREEAVHAMEAALRIVRTAVIVDGVPHEPTKRLVTSFEPATAFILMWMDKARPELVDVHETVKEVFAEFGITARRADEVQHQDRITDIVLDQISRSEFLFADLSGERPNVYYEVGYAHASGKRPILYRRAGTPLHFDLSVHNVPEYENVTTLRRSLRERLAAITGRAPKGGA